MGYTTLYDDGELRVVHRAGSSPFTLATFPGLGVWASARHMWAEEPVEKLDIEAVGFLCKRGNWYPLASVERAAPAVRAVLKPVAIGYGYSMGGYGVLKHGRRVGLTHVVALSPQISVDPADVPLDTRFHSAFDPAMHQHMRVVAEDLPPWALMVYDPAFAGDRMQAGLVQDIPGLTFFRYPYLDHATLGMLAGTTTLRDFIGLVADGDMAAVRAYLRALRPRSAHWFRYVARANAMRGRWDRAEKLWRRALALGLLPEAIRQDRAAILQGAGEGRRRPSPRPGKDKAAVAANAAVQRLARQGAWVEAVDAARRLGPETAEPPTVHAAIGAALEAGDPAAIEAMATLAMRVDMPRGVRCGCAMRLARGGQAALALDVLLSDPGILEEGPAQAAAVATLRHAGAAGEGPAQVAAQQLLRRLLNAVPEEPVPSPFAFGGASAAGLAVLLGPEVAVSAAPGVAAPAVAEVRRRLADVVTQVELSREPQLRVFENVFVNRIGQVWNAEGRQIRTRNLPLSRTSFDAMVRAPVIEDAVLAVEASGRLRLWLTEGLPAIAWRLDGAGEGVPLLLSEDAPPGVAASLALAAAGEPPPVVPVGDAVQVRRLHVSDVTLRHLGHHAAFQPMLSRIVAHAGTAEGAGGVVCLAAPEGREAPDPDWQALMAEFGIRTLPAATMPLEALLAELNGAAAIVAAPGACLAPVALARPGRRVFEVLPVRADGPAGQLDAANLSRIRGHGHHLWLEPAGSPGSVARLSVPGLRAALGAFLAG